MTDDNLRAAHEAEQAEMQNELQSEQEYQDWVRNWKRDDLSADLTFNHARTRHTLAVAEHLSAKAHFWESLSSAMLVLVFMALVAGVITACKVLF